MPEQMLRPYMPTTPTPPFLSVIIPNWNGAHLLPTCLESLKRQTYTDLEIIVVDNASTDNSRELISRDYSSPFPGTTAGVRVVALDSNRGFAGGVNAGIRAARGKVIVLLNNDTEAEATWLEELVRALQSDSRAGMAASKLRLFDERDKLHSAGDFYRVDGVPGNRGVWEVDRGQYDDAASTPPVFGACAGAAAYRRELFDRIGVFDEDLGSYCEDVDLNWRARLAGYGCVYAPLAVVYHHLSATGGGCARELLRRAQFHPRAGQGLSHRAVEKVLGQDCRRASPHRVGRAQALARGSGAGAAARAARGARGAPSLSVQAWGDPAAQGRA